MSIIQGNAHTSAGGGYQIGRSLRFNSADSAYLNRTPGSATDRQKWTWSSWVKLGSLTINQMIFSAGATSGANVYAYWNTTNTLSIRFDQEASGNVGVTAAVNRDPSAWYHVVFALDTTQATAANRVKIYINGVQQDTTGSTFPSQNFNTAMNNNVAHNIGRRGYDATSYASFLLSEIIHVDGQQLTPSSFGETDSTTGVWKPKKYAGTYGTNGFYLKFADNSGTTATTLGKDSSGNGNNWTPNNFSVTAGVGNDSLVDTPTPYGSDTGAGGEVRGNYCTLNPLQNTSVTLSNGNLQATYAPGSWVSAQATMPIPKTGKWKYEVTPTTMTYGFLAIVKPSSALTGTSYNNTNNYAWYLDSGEIRYSGTNLVTVTAASANDICEVRVDNGTVSFYRNGTLQHTFTQLLTDISDDYFPAVYIQSGAVHQYNFGQRPFAYTPSGFKALCTQNLSTPTIGATATTQANKYFDVQTYTGNGTNARVITTNLNEVGLAWVKIRSGVDDHRLANVLTGGNKHLKSNNTDAESTGTTVIQAFSGSTFTIGTDNSVNVNGSTYVAWAWNAGGSNATNTSGTITSTVRANTTSGFSIVTYTGTGSNATVGHGLGVAPSMVIVKIRSTTGYWTVQHSALGSGYYGYLNFTNSFDTANANLRWNGTNPSSTVFSIGTASDVNTSSATYVAYCFAPVAGYSAFGSYTGNGSTDGTFVYTGFRPRYVLVKSFNNAENWAISDTSRSLFNAANAFLRPDESSAETTGAMIMDFLSNGFKLRTADTKSNGSGYSYIYAAFAESPFKYSLAR